MGKGTALKNQGERCIFFAKLVCPRVIDSLDIHLFDRRRDYLKAHGKRASNQATEEPCIS